MNVPGAQARWCVLIPCYNESRAIRGVIESVLKLNVPVIVIDDGSDDGTAEIVAALPVTLLQISNRSGKGEALRNGFREALARGFDAVLTMDGDGQHSAADIPAMLHAATQHPKHIVTAARLVHRERQPKARRWANNFADWGISIACGQRLIDTQSGQRYYPRDALELADIPAEGFVFESDILIESAWQKGVRVASVPIESRYESSRHASEFRLSHFKPVSDFLSITSHVVWKTLTSGRLFKHWRAIRGQAPLLIGHADVALPEHIVRE